MLDSHARIVESSRRMGIPSGDGSEAEQAVSFPFRVQWSTLFVALESAKAPLPPIAFRDNPTPTPVPSVSKGIKDHPASGSSSTVQWEMVVPKMVRPSARISSTIEATPPPLPRSPCTYQLADQPRSPDPEHGAVPEPIPLLDSGRSRWFRWAPGAASLTAKLLLGGALLAGFAVPVVLRMNRPSSHASVGADVRGGGWMREASAPVGAKQARQLVLYRPSLGATDCRLEFTWKINHRALAWTFRAKDKDNYYAMGIKALRPGPSPTLSVEHFTVYQGVESEHANKVLILSENEAALQIRLEVTGATFKLYLAGNAADYWTDNRLTAGGLGFLEQPDQPAEVQSVRMSFSQAGGA